MFERFEEAMPVEIMFAGGGDNHIRPDKNVVVVLVRILVAVAAVVGLAEIFKTNWTLLDVFSILYFTHCGGSNGRFRVHAETRRRRVRQLEIDRAVHDHAAGYRGVVVVVGFWLSCRLLRGETQG
jgi:hypothetical protein